MEEFPLSRTHFWIEPGPVILMRTAFKGHHNIMTAGFQMMVQHEPPLLGCVIGPWDYSFKVLRATKECVVAIPTVDLATTVVEIGNCSGEEVDKFNAFNLTALPAEKVKAPLIAECLCLIVMGLKNSCLYNKNHFSYHFSAPLRMKRNHEYHLCPSTMERISHS